MKLAISLLALLSTSLALAAPSPYPPYLEDRFVAVEAGTSLATSAVSTAKIAAGAVTEAKVAAQTTEGLHLKRIARVTYDVAVDGGTSTAHLLGVTLPAKSTITRSWFYTDTQFSDSGAGTVALSCAAANDIKTATDITGNAAGVIVEGQSTGAASAFKDVTTACEVTATVAVVPQLTGKLTAWIEYVVHD